MSTSPQSFPPPPTTAPVPAAALAETQNAAAGLQLAGWIGFWLQGAIALISLVILGFASFSRNVATESNTATVGFSLFLAAGGLFVIAFGTFLNFRYTRLARRLRRPEPIHHPSKADTLSAIRLGLIANLGGLAIGLLGTELGIGTLLAKSFSQPQGLALYDPDQIIRVLDILVPLINVNLATASFVGVLASLWLTQRID